MARVSIESRAERSGRRLTYGDAMRTPIVFLHGGGLAAVSWTPHMTLLGDERHMLALDLPAHGAERHRRWTTMDDAADAVSRALRERGLGRVHVVGFSLGADVALRLIARHPALVDAAVLTGISTSPVPWWGRLLDVMSWPVMAMPFTHRLLAREMRLSDDLRRAHLASTRPVRIGDYSRLSRQVLAGVSLAGVELASTRVLALAGQRESAHCRRSAVILTRRLTAAGLESEAAFVPRAGHSWPLSSPAAVADIVRAWIDRPGVVDPRLVRYAAPA